MDITLSAATEELDVTATRSYAQDVWRRLLSAPGTIVGLVIVAIIVIVALFAPWIAHVDPLAQNLNAQTLHPSAAHLFGTDKLGRDVFARVVYGARISIRIGFVAVGIAIVVGTLLGVVAGFFGGKTDESIMAGVDVMLAFPSIILAIGITTILGPSIDHLMLAVGIVYIPQYARLARSSVLAVNGLEYIEAARALGAQAIRILGRHVLPNIVAPLLVQATLGIATATLEAAGLSYLGLGARPPIPEWGAMLNDARDYWLSAPWALILLGDGLRDALDPTQR
jgi:peptide/nickel transport system permease protein